jgi:flagellar L-ring protein FlgH
MMMPFTLGLPGTCHGLARLFHQVHYHAPAPVAGLLGLLLFAVAPVVMAESLFLPNTEGLHPRANAPRMLYSPPRPQQVGDLLTIRLEEESERQNQSTTQIQKENEFNENTSQVLNTAVSDVLARFGGGKWADYLRLPSLGGIANSNSNRSQGNVVQKQIFEDTISCQVMQVLPNGNLMVQGRKTIAHAKEKTDFYVTGIVNPYFLNSENEISSQKVGNLQVMVAGNGIITRSQNDGIISKIMSYVQ